MKSWYCSSEKTGQEKMDTLRETFLGLEDASTFQTFLTELLNLERIPLEYLVCDETLLPPESIRFFWVDEGWLAALIDGACSVGRSTEFDLKHDQLLLESAWPHLRRQAAQARSRRLSLPFDNQQEASVRTGFLLRSDLVSGWPDLNIGCFSAGHTPLTVQRLERLSGDLLLCLVQGVLESVELTEPETGLSFGFDRDEQGALVLPLTPLPAMETNSTRTVSRTRTALQSVPVPFRQQSVPGVLNLEALQDSIADTLSLDKKSFSALETAAELLRTPLRSTIKGGLL